MLDPKTCRKLLIFGGSFDPPHRAHIDLPLAAARQLSADGVLFVPAGQPPHKTGKPLTPAAHRLAMLKLALGNRPDAAICTWELDQPGPSYTVQTLEHLKRELGNNMALHLLIGADMAAIFNSWKDPDRIEALAPLCIMRRPGEKLSGELPDRWRKQVVDVPQMDVSSTQLRQQLQKPETPETPKTGDHLLLQFLHPDVLDYIRQSGLYRSA